VRMDSVTMNYANSGENNDEALSRRELRRGGLISESGGPVKTYGPLSLFFKCWKAGEMCLLRILQH
jgi:hypothetical protein